MFMTIHELRHYRNIVDKMLTEAVIPLPDKSALEKARIDRLIKNKQLPEWFKYISLDKETDEGYINFNMPLNVHFGNITITNLQTTISLQEEEPESFALTANFTPPIENFDDHPYQNDSAEDIEDIINSILTKIGFTNPEVMFSESGMQDNDLMHFDSSVPEQIFDQVKKVYKIP